MTEPLDVDSAPDPDTDTHELLAEQNTVGKVSPDTTWTPRPTRRRSMPL